MASHALHDLRRRTVVQLMLGALAIAALTSTTALAADKIRIGKPEATGFVFSAAEVGVEAGIFKKHNIDIETISFAGGAKMHQAMAAKTIDMALGSGPEMAFIPKGSPEKGVAAMAGAPLSIVVLVRGDSDYKTIDDLKGRTIGVSNPGALTYWLAGELAKRKGWGPEGFKRVPLGGMDGMVAGLLAKNVDSIVGNTEIGYKLQAEGKVKLIGRFGEIIPDFITHVIFASNDMIEKNPDAIRRFLKAWYETVSFMRANKEETIRIATKVTGFSPEFAESIYREQMPMFLDNGRFDPKGVEVLKQSFIDLKILPDKPQNDQLFTEAFLPK